MTSRGVIDLGLSRILRLLNKLGNPHENISVVHVTGTNGKGSVSSYIHSILSAAGLKAGLFTSPYLIEPRDCVRVGQTIPSKEQWESIMRDTLEATRDGFDGDKPTNFEVLVASALKHFQREEVDIAVIEVGVGGRLDATNVFERPLACVITSLALDHEDLLGPGLSLIAHHKAGIIKAGRPVVLGQLPTEGRSIILKEAESLKAPVFTPPPAMWTNISENIAAYQNLLFRLPLLGNYQLTNSALAIQVSELLRQEGYNLSQEHIVKGIEATRWRGRLEWCQSPTNGMRLLVDGAHNVHAAKALREYVDTLPGQHDGITWIMAMTATKDSAGIFKEILRENDTLLTVPFQQPEDMPWIRCTDPKQLAARASQVVKLRDTQSFASLDEAITAANSISGTTVLCGSLYLVSEIIKKWG
eukprot:Colp12_sorted_trinity150504_noHs@7152